MIIISSMAHASSWMNLPLALLVFLLSGVVLGSAQAAFDQTVSFDWRNNNGRANNVSYVTSVKNQGGLCDNSWAFAAVSLAESAMLINGWWPEGGLDLSEQQVVDCSSFRIDRYGCHGGTVKNALRFITGGFGISQELDYPLYTGLSTGNCRKPRGSAVGTHGLRWYRLVGRSENQLARELVRYSPIAVTICHHPDLNWYREGIYKNQDCCREYYNTTISMTLVGYGTQDGIPYWTLKNSWGTLWGERGFLKLARGSNMCGIVTHPSYSVLTPAY